MSSGPSLVLKNPRVTLWRPVSTEIVRAYGGSFDPAKPFMREWAQAGICKWVFVASRLRLWPDAGSGVGATVSAEVQA
jgi:hypothetical protein